MTDWITDRLPTEADADEHGEVLAQGKTWSGFVKWKRVTTGTHWRHTSLWRSPDGVAPTTTIPRKFTSITHSDDRYLALADDGTAWFNFGKGWLQLDPLPAREVTA